MYPGEMRSHDGSDGKMICSNRTLLSFYGNLLLLLFCCMFLKCQERLLL